MNKFIILILFCISANFFSQPTSQSPVGPITDVPSMVGSLGILAEGYIIKDSEKESEKKIKNFISAYQKRLLYITGATWLSTVNSIITNVQDRVNLLKKDNEKLSLLFYSQKKENKAYLDSVETQIDNMSSHFLNGETLTMLGEKMNLYDSLRNALSIINRQLDLIEDNIKNSNIKKKIIQKFVN